MVTFLSKCRTKMRKKIRIPLRTDPVVVLGMHRSGTTLLTRILSRLGIFMGHKLQVTHEPIFFRDLDNDLLSIAHAAWDMPLNVSYLLENEDYKRRIIDYTPIFTVGIIVKVAPESSGPDYLHGFTGKPWDLKRCL